MTNMVERRSAYRERDHLEDLVVDERIILNWILKTYDRGADSIHLGQYVNKWPAIRFFLSKL